MVKLSNYGRRKRKPHEYEPDPILSTPKIEDKETIHIEIERTRAKVIPDKPDGVLPIVGDNTAKHRGYEEIYAPLADKYHPPIVIRPPKVPDKPIETPLESTTSTPKVTESEAIVRESIDEYVPGWGKVFGHKDKKVKTTG